MQTEANTTNTNSSPTPFVKSLRTFLLVILAVVIYAYAVEGTRINLQTPMEPRRQDNLINVLRLLAQPDLFVYSAQGQIVALSEASLITLERIIETVFMALMASTIGTMIAIPISFVAARNLMEPVRMPLAGITTALIVLPLGGFVLGTAVSLLIQFGEQIATLNWLALLIALASFAGSWAVVKLGPELVTTESPTRTQSAIATGRLIIAAILGFLGLAVLSHLGLVAGLWLEERLGIFGFVGNFIFVLSDFFRLVSPILAMIVGAMVGISLGSRVGQEFVLGLGKVPGRLFTGLVSVLGTAVAIYGIGTALNWLYQFNNPAQWTTYPALAGGLIMGIIGVSIDPRRPFAIGLVVYSLFRTVLNLTRSIESLIMAIVFVIWVGVGPFAGVLALTLHTTAALGKLFSEQVESIATGPVEGVIATGANRLQTIVYAVIPQVIPPYLAFAFYRWDINVRMSTIIGFVGGGGIGFVLSQNINLLRYQQASVMMLAIAIVVATLDYLSSKVRERII